MNGDDPGELVRKLSESFRSVKLARGVVGKTGQAMLGLLGIYGVVGLQLSDNLTKNLALIAIAILATAVFFWWTRATQKFARENPAQALLEGAELLEYQKFEAQIKGLPTSASTPRISDPDKPQLIVVPPEGQ